MKDKISPSMVDPWAMWREWVVKSEQQWSEGLTKLLKDDQVVATLGSQLQQARFVQKMFAEAMQPFLSGANLPTRSDLELVEERLGKVEDGLAAVQAEIVRLRTALAGAQAVSPGDAGVINLPRTRKPAERE